MPHRLTSAGLRWIRIAENHPDRDSTAIFKLTQFALKRTTDDREFERLIREAHQSGHEPDAIANACATSADAITAIIRAPIDDTNRPKETRKRDEPDVISQLKKLAPASLQRRERLEGWVERAIKDGWSVDDTAAAAKVTMADVERLAADELDRRRVREAGLCSFCGKDKDEVSVYCKHAAKHALAVEARQGSDHRAFSAKYEAAQTQKRAQ